MVNLRKIARSPHILEVVTCYGGMGFFLTFICLWKFQMPFLQFFSLYCVGAAIYTFLEYWFHRFLLHELLHSIHNNHHLVPRNLRIIATPMIPVQLVGFTVIYLLIKILGKEVSYALNTGICFGQCMMDLVHVAFHSPYRPWFLESARSFHLHHHFREDSDAHGLTTSFWDMIFGTFPKQWYYYKKYPWLKYVQLPFPLLTFAIIGLLSGDTTKSTHENDTRHKDPRYKHGDPRPSSFVITFLCTILYYVLWESAEIPIL